METTADTAKRINPQLVHLRSGRRRFRSSLRSLRRRTPVDGLVQLDSRRSLAGRLQMDVPRLRCPSRHSADSPSSKGLLQRVSAFPFKRLS